MLSFSAKRLSLSLLIALTSLTTWSQQITQPRIPSPAATVAQKVGISTVTVNYSRPSVNGREIWGTLVPFGWNKQGFGNNNEAPWRAGANENTTITFTHDAEVEGHNIPAGSYGLFYVINKDNTGEVILSKDYKSWGSFWYNPESDAMRANIRLRSIPMTERLTYEFDSITKNTAELLLNWEKKQFPVKIQFAVDEIVLANAEEELKGTTGFTWQGYASAANYALQNKTHTDQALRWIDQAIAQNSNFNTLSIKSGLLKETGKEADADKLMNEALAMATEGELNNYGYQLLAGGQVDKAIEMFKLNTQRHPKSANTWDSLGEGYATKGDKKNAIANFKKSLSMNPPPNVKANSEKYLKQLGAM
jgi:predicted negative regulator of RcsB-dependent stress response